VDYEKDHAKEQAAEVREKMEHAKAEAQVSFKCAMSIVAPHLNLTAPRACSQSFVPASSDSYLHLGLLVLHVQLSLGGIRHIVVICLLSSESNPSCTFF